MTKHIINIISVILTLTLCSCATMFNSKRTSVTVIASEPSCLIIGKDTTKNSLVSKSFIVDRDKEPIIITAISDSINKSVSVAPKNSFAYWLNLYPNFHLWTGFYIDTKTKRRYTYPKTVYINLTKMDSSYLTYKPLDTSFDVYSNIFKITPLKLIGVVNPAIELSYERKTGHSLSTQLMASYLLPMSIMDIGSDFKPNTKGYRVSIEEKLYLKKSAPYGAYAAFELNYLNNRYNNIGYFGTKNVDPTPGNLNENYSDTFGVKKQTYSFNLKLGYQYIIKRFSFDFYAGLGLRYKNARHFDRINPADELKMPRHPNVHYEANREGKLWTVSIPLNARIGWIF